MRHQVALWSVVSGLVVLAACGGGDSGVRSKDGSGLSASGDSSPTTAVVVATTREGTPSSTTPATPPTDGSASTTTPESVEPTLPGSTVPDPYPLQEGSAGPEVERLQQALERAGYDIGSSRVDGGFGPDTASGLRMFQRVNGLPITGRADRALVAVIESAPVAPLFVIDRTGLGAARIGDDPESVIAYLAERLGPPAEDDGWGPAIGPCALTETRRVSWPGLAVTFGDYSVEASAIGPRQLILVATAYDPTDPPDPRYRTDRGLHPGDTIARLLRLYPAAEVFPDDGMFGPSYRVGDEIYGGVRAGSPDRVGNILVGEVPCGE